jgi:hypothetical protein
MTFIFDPDIAMPGRIQRRSHVLCLQARDYYAERDYFLNREEPVIAGLMERRGDEALKSANALADEWSE